MPSKLHNIQALRAFAVLLVVGLHLLAVEVKYSQVDVLLPTFLRIGLSGVDLFFVISGFIMVTVTAPATVLPLAARGDRAIRFLFLRLTRIYPLYWLVSAVVLGIFWVHPSFLNLPNFSGQFVLNSFLLLPQQGLPLVMVGWSLIHEIYFYLVFSLLLLLPRKYLPYLLFAWLGLVVEGFQGVDYYNPDQNPFSRLAFSPVTAEFIAGCYLALFFECRENRQARYPLASMAIVTGLLLLAVLWHFFSFDAQTIDVVGWTRVYLFTGPYVLMMYGAVALEKNRQRVAPTWIVRIGDHSYSTYLTHVLVLSVCGRVWKTFAWHGYADNVVILTITVIAVLITGKYCYQWLEKPALDFSRRFIH
jgi:exopolysaccharide production protein ExoZ